MLFYFDFGRWTKMVALAWGEPRLAVRGWFLLRLLVLVPAVASFHALCFLLDGILFPRLHAVEVRTPVFLVGHARSGTTLLHRLMSLDAERFSSFRLYELYFPSLMQKKLIRALGAFDRRFLGKRLSRRMKAWDERRYRATRDMHAMSLFKPEEDDVIFYYSCASGFWMTKLPYMGKLDFYFIDERPERERRRLLRFYRQCVQRQLYLNGAHKVHLSKNPTFAGRVGALIESFPDARIGVTMRNPNETIPSLLKLLKVTYQRYGTDPAEAQRSLRVLADQSFHTYLHPLDVLAKHPATKHAIVDYAELVGAPKRTVEEAYAQLGFAVTPEFAAVLDAEERRAKKHETSHSYSLEEFGLRADEIRERLAELFERFQWDAEPPAKKEQPHGT